MSSSEKTIYYTALEVGDRVQDGDQWLNEYGHWQPYVFLSGENGVVGYGVRARRPIPATGQVTYEEVPGSRTTQNTVVRPHRERIAYEELRPGTEVQAGDQYRNTQGRWVEYSIDTSGVPIVGPTAMARRPYNISAILEISDALASAQKAATQLQDERDELKAALRECRAAHQVTMADGLAACKDRDAANAEIQRLLKTITDNADMFADAGKILEQERDEARAEVARLSTELWARKPLEDRISSLTDELAQARAERDRLQEVVSNLYSEPTARQVQQMLRTWATELDWSAGCFDSPGREQIDTIQKTMVAVIERIEHMINPEGNTDGE